MWLLTSREVQQQQEILNLSKLCCPCPTMPSLMIVSQGGTPRWKCWKEFVSKSQPFVLYLCPPPNLKTETCLSLMMKSSLLVSLLLFWHPLSKQLLSAQKLATASMILPTICKLLHVLEVANDDSSAIKLVKRAIHDDLSVRYPPGPTRGFLQICSFLDPRFKGLSFLTETEVSDTLDQVSKECILLINRQISDDPVVKRECPQVSDPSTESAKSDILPSNPHIIPVPSLSSSHGDGEPVTDTLKVLSNLKQIRWAQWLKGQKLNMLMIF